MAIAAESRQQVRFAEFRLDLLTGELWRDGEKIAFPHQSFQILGALLEQPGQLVTREELVKRLWASDVFVDFEGSLNKAIKRLRETLGDSAEEPRFIETLPRRGYRFIAPVEGVRTPVESASPIGRKVSHYRVLEVIGGGGMGLVYKAEDLKLGRQVALKFLPEELGSDAQALERFGREARVVSSLDHPNICPIFEFGEHDGRPFMVMQLLEGQTLRDRVARDERALPLGELLDIGIQVSDGLQAAHEKGIIHRDIKPANIFLTSKGVVKILDFGLAKLVEAEAHPSKTSPSTSSGQALGGAPAGVERGFSPASANPLSLSSRATRSSAAAAGDRGVEGPALDSDNENAGPSTARPPVPRKTRDGEERGRSAQDDSIESDDKIKIGEHTLTRTGVAMGTAGYMSPEQVCGEKLDARSDIFSFGLVLYEMATGRRAFTGETAAVIHDAILNKPPIPASDLNPTLPAKLVVTIDKALEKDRDQRYQTATELGNELQKLKAETDGTKPRTRRWPLWLAAALLMLATGSALWFSRHRPGEHPEATEIQVTANPVGDRITGAAISPDGKYVAYYDERGLYLRTIDGGETHSIALPAEMGEFINGLCWFPGEQKLIASMNGKNGRELYVINLLASAESHLLYRQGIEPSISPDGQMVVFTDEDFGKEILVGGMNGETPRKLIAAQESQTLFSPVWSPDGRWIAYVRAWKRPDGTPSSAIEARPAEGGPAKTLLAESSLPQGHMFIRGNASLPTQVWTPDWRLVFTVSESLGTLTHFSLWQRRIKASTLEAEDKPERLTKPSSHWVWNLTATADGKRLMMVKWASWLDVYLGELGSGGTSMKPPRRLTLDDRGNNLQSWSRDGRAVLFESMRNGKSEIFQQGVNQNVAEKILSGVGDVYGVSPSPDGAWYLYFESAAVGFNGGSDSDPVQLMRRATAGGAPEKMMELTRADGFRCSSNPGASSPCVLALERGHDLIFYALDPIRGKGGELGKIEFSSPDFLRGWDISPGGSQLAFVDLRKYGSRIEVLDLKNGAWHEIPLERPEHTLTGISWTADGQGFLATSVTRDSFSLLHVTLTGKLKFLLARQSRLNHLIYAPAASSDGKYLAYIGQTWDSNVWMIDNF